MCSHISKIEEFIEQNVGETKYLSEWCRQINEEVLPKCRGLSNRQLSYIFNRVISDKFTVNHTNSYQYTFSR
jgi:hypothetical protein